MIAKEQTASKVRSSKSMLVLLSVFLYNTGITVSTRLINTNMDLNDINSDLKHIDLKTLRAFQGTRD